MGADHDMRAVMATLPVPDLDGEPFARAPELTDASVAIVTTAGLHTADDEKFGLLDPAFRVLPHGRGDLRMSHNSQNFDRSGIMLDRNVAYPVDRLDELAASGVIGRVSPSHFSFMGAQQDLSTILQDTGPLVAKLLRDQDTDVVLLTPVSPLCTRTVCALAYVFESAGIATVSLVSMVEVATRMHPPRALYGDFPLGRPLGRPNDPEFQHRVLASAFGLLASAKQPTLITFPEVVVDEVDVPLSCPMPARLDASVPASVDEMRGLRRAFDRAADSGIRTALDPEDVEAALFAFERVVAGTPWVEAEIPDNPLTAALGIRSYYEQAAAGLSDHVPAARAAESWFAQTTASGALMREAMRVMRDQKAPQPFWFYLLPVSQHRRD